MKTAIALSLLLFSPFVMVEGLETKVVVETTLEDDVYLLETFKSQGYIAKFAGECCVAPSDPEYGEATGIWVGRNVPYEDVKKIVFAALDEYPHLSYYAFFGRSGENYPKEWDRTIFIGGFVPNAEGFKKIDSPRAKELFSKVSSQEELEQLLISFRKRSDPEPTESGD